MDDRCRGLTRVHDERVAFGEPAHRDLPAVAFDLLGLYRAALLGDAEERLEKKTALRAATCEAAGLIGSRERIQDRLDRRNAARVLARDRVDAAEHPDGKAAASLRGAPKRLRGGLWLVDLRVIRAEGRASPARLRDQILEEEDVVAKVGRVAELVRERLVAGNEVDVLVLVLDRLAERIEIAVPRDDEPVVDVLAVLVEQLEGPRDKYGVGTPLEQSAAHALRDGDGLHARELEGHEERVVLRRDLLTEDRELHADRSELGGFLQDRLQDRKC